MACRSSSFASEVLAIVGVVGEESDARVRLEVERVAEMDLRVVRRTSRRAGTRRGCREGIEWDSDRVGGEDPSGDGRGRFDRSEDLRTGQFGGQFRTGNTLTVPVQS